MRDAFQLVQAARRDDGLSLIRYPRITSQACSAAVNRCRPSGLTPERQLVMPGWDRGGLRESCRQSGYTLRDEGELMLQQCCLLALADSLMRLRGWWLPN